MVKQPLILALNSPRPETVFELLERGADIPTDNEVSGFYSFPDYTFTLAVELGRVELLGESSSVQVQGCC
jgi:hypothetical protein